MSDFDRTWQVARTEAVLWSRRMLAAEKPLAVIDFETTGKLPCEPVQVGIVGVYEGKIVTLLNALVRPKVYPLHPEAERVHGISEAMVSHAPLFAHYLPAIHDIVESHTMVAYNAGFDGPVLSLAAKIAGVEEYNPKIQCAMLKYAGYNGEWKYSSWTWVKLEKACTQMGVKLDGAHDAVADCVATVRLMQALAEVNLDE